MFDEVPRATSCPGPTRCYAHWDDLPDAPSVVPAMRALSGAERTAAPKYRSKAGPGSCVTADGTNHARAARGRKGAKSLYNTTYAA